MLSPLPSARAWPGERNLLPHVLRYNASLPSKFMPAHGYSAHVAAEAFLAALPALRR